MRLRNAARMAIVLMAWLAACVAHAHGALPAPVRDALAQAGVPASAVGVVVQEVGRTSPTLSLNADTAFNPASTIKLLTTFAALDLLGPSFTWRTEAYTLAPPNAGVVDGDLYLKGSGDPKLTYERVWLLLREVKERGVSEIKGDLVLDKNVFAKLEHDPANFDGQPLRVYNVGPDALLANFKAVRFVFAPQIESARVLILPQPIPATLDIQNDVVLTNGECGDWKERITLAVERAAARTRVTFTGRYPIACGDKPWYVSLYDHDEYLAELVRELWRSLGGKWNGSVRHASIPVEARLVVASESAPLSEVVRDINKISSNVMARQLYLTLGTEGFTQPGSPANAFAVIKGWLKGKGLAMPELVLDNGSGLSRDERISAGSLNRLLQAAWKSAVMPEFISSMPLVAADGTMRRRLKYQGIAGQAHIKSGSLEGVRALAGYVLDAKGRRHSVVFMVNHANAAATHAAQDALLQWVYAGGTTPDPLNSR